MCGRIIYNQYYGPEHQGTKKGNIKPQINVIEHYYSYSVILQKTSTNYRWFMKINLHLYKRRRKDIDILSGNLHYLCILMVYIWFVA